MADQKADYTDEDEHLWMSAYYFDFEPTGIFVVDRVLSEIAHAGKSYHSTEGWSDEDEGPSHITRIQRAASQAADLIRLLRALTVTAAGDWPELTFGACDVRTALGAEGAAGTWHLTVDGNDGSMKIDREEVG